jgi:hypothetical protein
MYRAATAAFEVRQGSRRANDEVADRPWNGNSHLIE